MKPLLTTVRSLPTVQGIGPADATTLTRAGMADFLELTKPRMNVLILITTLLGFYFASSGPVQWVLLLHTLLGTAMCAASAAAFNHLVERRHDAAMPRTARRPLAARRLSPGSAFIFALALGVIGTLHLLLAVNVLTSILALSTIALYVGLYTPLKRVSWTNTLVGAVPGAIPPMIGYTAVTGQIDLAAMSLFAILFFWQMPHFYAIATLYRDDYASAGFKMLPCDDPALRRTRRQSLLFTLGLLLSVIGPYLLGLAGVGYLVFGVVLTLGFFAVAARFARTGLRADARRLFLASIVHLPLLLAALAVGRV